MAHPELEDNCGDYLYHWPLMAGVTEFVCTSLGILTSQVKTRTQLMQAAEWLLEQSSTQEEKNLLLTKLDELTKQTFEELTQCSSHEEKEFILIAMEDYRLGHLLTRRQLPAVDQALYK
jgi:hypothetical protein